MDLKQRVLEYCKRKNIAVSRFEKECWQQELNRTLLNILDRWDSALLRLRESGDTGSIVTAVQLRDALLGMAEKKEAKGDPANLFLARFTAYMESRTAPGTRRIYDEANRRVLDFVFKKMKGTGFIRRCPSSTHLLSALLVFRDPRSCR